MWVLGLLRVTLANDGPSRHLSFLGMGSRPPGSHGEYTECFVLHQKAVSSLKPHTNPLGTWKRHSIELGWWGIARLCDRVCVCVHACVPHFFGGFLKREDHVRGDSLSMPTAVHTRLLQGKLLGVPGCVYDATCGLAWCSATCGPAWGCRYSLSSSWLCSKVWNSVFSKV